MSEQQTNTPAMAHTRALTLADIAERHPSGATPWFRIRRGLRKVWHFLLPHNIPRVVTRGGIRYFLYYNDCVDNYLLRKGQWEPGQVVFFFNEARRRGARVFFDIGANFGYYSLLAARLGIFDEIHAFEPHPETYQRLLWHINANKFDGVITPHNVATSDGAGEMRMNIAKDGNSGGRHVFTDGSNAPSGTVAIKARTLDSMFSFHGRNICAKIDVEGHEMQTINGARELLARNKSLLQVEVWGHKAPLITDIASRGFKLLRYEGGDFYFVNED